ncbi:hypothetical protein K450DRAFT_225645 [Umbelopsis ramanniana AG]|uniref:Uncharacterized protein n=1 Tax=Umbelopsis ramanniana AG TaxID=1314678 RepID=A0AAD5HG02_UMBRA|nr:uncharacterized protein K450DRAFT_225645 [Umbelopsis ramanniana AG]KAI8582960.1 hypothetical protein K450DRAFT_225645 [Umbelopsis ramanniana AG]
MEATYIPEALVVVTLQGMVVGFSFEIFFRFLFAKNEPRRRVRILKCLMGLSMGLKLLLFLAMNCALGLTACSVVGRLGDLLYHVSMVFGNAVLLDRVATIVPSHLTKRFEIAHYIILAIRSAIGIIDAAIVTVAAADNLSCVYQDNIAWGPVYTFYDTFTDFYVTLCITTILIMHVRKVKNVHMATNINLFIAIGATNILRTIVLMISNLASAVLILTEERQAVIMIAWPVINLLFILLVGYDTDIARLIRKAQRPRSHHNNSSRTGLTPHPDGCENYSSDKMHSNQSLPVVSPHPTENIYQLQPTTHDPLSRSSPIDPETGQSSPSIVCDEQMFKDLPV